jgi:hypothetical protein
MDLGPLVYNPDAPQVPDRPTPNRANAKRVYREFPVGLFSTVDWDIPTVQSVIQQHELGQFSMSARLIRQMGQDDTIESCLETLILGILRLPFAFTPAKETAKGLKAMQFVADLWAQAVPDPQLFEWISWAIMGGIGIAEVVWDTTEDDWRPIGLKVWQLEHFYWLETARKYICLTADGPVEVNPGDGKWLVLSIGGLRGHLKGAVRSIWSWWIIRDMASRDWARHSEILGQGIFKAHIPTDADEPDKEAFIASVQTAGSDGIVELAEIGSGPDKKAFDLGLLEAEFDHGESFEKLLLRCEANIRIRLQGQNATQDNSGGPYVARGVFSKVTLDKIDGLVGPLQTCLGEQLCRPICEFNFDDAGLAPSPKWDAEPPPDKKEFADTLLSLGQFLVNATNGGYTVTDLEALSERIGVKLSHSVLPAIQVATLAAEAKEKAALTATQQTPAPAESGVQDKQAA